MGRTTLTLDPDVTRLVERAMRRERRSQKDVVNDALRRALAERPTRPYVLVPHEGVPRPGIDPRGLNRLADELEAEEVGRRLAGRS